MRVALSLVTLDLQIAGGAATYVRGLCAALGRVGVNDYRALVPRIAPDAAGGLPTTVAAGFPVKHGPARRLRSIAGTAVRGGALGAVLEDADVVHYPVTVPVPSTRRPSVVTLHDLQHRDRPELFGRTKLLFRRLAYDRAAQRADQVIVVSEWVRERAIDLLHLDPARVHAVHHGVDLERFSPDASVAREPFLLYPARGWPHKNHARLLESFALLRRDHPELRLVLTGGGHERTSLEEGVEVRGHVSDAELASLYRRAAVLVFPSLYEGFGLPLLEAMACGCPVATSNAGALPEVCGDDAVLFDATDPAAIAEGVRAALDRSDDLSAAGPERAARFTWDRAAKAHDDVYALCV